MNLNTLASRSLLGACLTAGLLFSANANAGAVIAAFDFENVGSSAPTAAASATGAGISGAVFRGTRAGESSVLSITDKVFRSGGMIPDANGTFFDHFSFTTSSSLDLGTLRFEAG